MSLQQGERFSAIFWLAPLMLAALMPVSALAESPPWPEPLTLEYALSQPSTDHPQLQIAVSKIEQAQAVQAQVDADGGLEATLSGRLRWVDPPDISPDQSHDDHLLSLFVDKRLYDFGRTAARERAAESALASSEYRFRDVREQHRIAIMAAFFDVLLADQAYARDTEDMSMTYVRYDRARHRNELGQLSDIDLLEKRSLYQTSRLHQAQSQAAQRTTRAYLANLLNRPDQLPSELAKPVLNLRKGQLPEEVDAWLAELEQSNPQLLALEADVQSAEAELNVARVKSSPVLNANAEASKYSRELGSSDHWRAGVTLSVPLFDGGRSDSAQAQSLARLHQVRSRLEQKRRDLRQRLLMLWTELQTLQVARQRFEMEQEYRDLYLDRSRALYDLEVATDLGDAMVRMTALRFNIMKADFDTALAWANVDALLGKSSQAGAASKASAGENVSTQAVVPKPLLEK